MGIENPQGSSTTPSIEQLLEKARKEDEAKKVTPTQPEAPVPASLEKSAAGGIDDLLQEIQSEKQPEKKAGIEKEGLKETVEKMMPKINHLVEIIVGEKMADKGKMDYAALSGNVDAYIDARRSDVESEKEAKILLKEIMDQIEDSPGDFNNAYNILKEQMSHHDLRAIIDFRDRSSIVLTRMNSNPGDAEKATVKFWSEGGNQARKAAEEEMSNRFSYVADGMVNRGMESTFGDPKKFIENMQQTYTNTLEHSSEDMVKNAIDSRPDRRAEGFAFAALDSGDVEVAAKALAFSNSIKLLDASDVARIKLKLEKLDSGKRKQFAEVFSQERNKKQE